MRRVPHDEPDVVHLGKVHGSENMVRSGNVDDVRDVSPERTSELGLEGITTAIGECRGHHGGGVGLAERNGERLAAGRRGKGAY